MLLYKIIETSQNQMGEIQRTDSDFPIGILLYNLKKQNKTLVGSNESYQELSQQNTIINVLC